MTFWNSKDKELSSDTFREERSLIRLNLIVSSFERREKPR